MTNPRSGTQWPEIPRDAADAGSVLNDNELDGIAAGDADYAKWKDAALEQAVSKLTLSTERTIGAGFSGTAKNMSHRLYDMETELIKRHIYGDYSQTALFWTR